MKTRYFHNLTLSYTLRRILLCIQGFTQYLQCHIGLQLHTCFITFDLDISLEKIGENNFNSNPAFLNFSCWERYNQPHIKYRFKQFL